MRHCLLRLGDKLTNLQTKPWWNYLETDLRELINEAVLLSEIFTKKETLPANQPEFHDYAFIVFPAAKAYEGFLKKLFLDLGFITKEDYFGKYFRIGKSLNPSLEKKYRNDSWVYEKLSNYCGNSQLSDQLWQTWKESRNLIFHWFPNEKKAISLAESQARFSMIIEAIDAAFATCKIKVK